MTNVADRSASTRCAALTSRLSGVAATEPAGRVAVICREYAMQDVELLEEALIALLGIPSTTETTLDIVAAAIGAHRR